jgi:ankyrin repeat protein
LREVLTEDPGAATVVSKDGQTPLWWLPDDETKAMQTVELLLAAGANPAAKSTDGDTAADWARRRGMGDVAVRLEAQGRSEDVRM